jgi:hypothetical protein
MPRRVSLPGAAELFRPTPAVTRTDTDRDTDPPLDRISDRTAGDTRPPEPADPHAGPAGSVPADRPAVDPGADGPAATRARRSARGTGRVRHDEKITVYVSSDELLELERARLLLRAEHGMAVDRGRIVREALALVIGDLAERGADSDLVRRLSQP